MNVSKVPPNRPQPTHSQRADVSRDVLTNSELTNGCSKKAFRNYQKMGDYREATEGLNQTKHKVSPLGKGPAAKEAIRATACAEHALHPSPKSRKK